MVETVVVSVRPCVVAGTSGGVTGFTVAGAAGGVVLTTGFLAAGLCASDFSGSRRWLARAPSSGGLDAGVMIAAAAGLPWRRWVWWLV